MIHYQKAIRKGSNEHKVAKFLFKCYNLNYLINWSHKRAGILGIAILPKQVVVYTHKVTDVVQGLNGYIKLKFKRCSKQEFLSTVFHEIQHFEMYNKGKYLNYHKGLVLSKTNYNEFLLWAKEYLIAEQTADRMAKKMMKECYPSIPFIGYYNQSITREGIKRTIIEICETYYPKKLNNLMKEMKYAK